MIGPNNSFDPLNRNLHPQALFTMEHDRQHMDTSSVKVSDHEQNVPAGSHKEDRATTDEERVRTFLEVNISIFLRVSL